MNAREIVIGETTVCTLSPQVRLGCGNIWEVEGRGATAGLWIMRPQTATRALRVGAGEQVDLPGYKVRVVEVTLRGPASRRGSLRIAVEAAAS